MGKKVYTPIVKEGDHLLHSTANPNRVRGLTRDSNNQNPDIIEWEEYDLDDLISDNCDSYSYESQHVQLTPEQKEFAQQIGEVLGVAIVAGGIFLFRGVIYPWWTNTAWPWVKECGNSIKSKVRGKKKLESTDTVKQEIILNKQFVEVSSQIDSVFEQCYSDMNEDEVREHILQLVYHMLGVANEIRIISNIRICKDCKSKEQRITRQKEAEKFLSEKVSVELDQLLSNENLQLDLDTVRELFSLTGGGVRLNGEYVPVQPTKIDKALKCISPSKHEDYI